MMTDPSSFVGQSHETAFSFFIPRADAPIIAGYSIYREAEYLRSSLDSICQYVDVVLILEGRYFDFAELPEDCTERIISETASRFDPRFYLTGGNPQKFVVFPTEPMLEVEKRDLFFAVVREGGYLFIIDGDEIAVGDVKAGLDFVRANDPTKVFWVYVEEEGNPGWKPRIIRVEQGLHYGKNHWTILNEKDEVLTDSVWHSSPDYAKIEQFKIYNFGSKRSGERGKARTEYRETMRPKNWAER